MALLVVSSNSIAGDRLDMAGLVPVRSLSTVAFGGWITGALAMVLAALTTLRASRRAR
jgi:hypothetical protein